jgi:peptide/nickel transport system substrate-binding protein
MWVSGLPARGSTMSTLRKILLIACAVALAAFGLAACGKKSEGGGGGGGES